MINFSFHNKTVVLMIKVAMLGGAERQALGLAHYLIEHYNCKVYVVATHSNEPTKEFSDFALTCRISTVHFFGVPSLTVHRSITFKNLKKSIRAYTYLKHITTELKKFNPYIIIPFLNTPSKIASLIYKRVGAKITFWHQLGLDNYTFDTLEKKAIVNIPFIISNASNGLSVFKNHYKVSENRLFVLPQYVSLQKINLDQSLLKKELNIPTDAIVIGMIAHYRAEKYHELLLKSFAEICKENKVHLVFLGNKNNSEATLAKYNKLINVSRQLNCDDKVSFLSELPVEKVLNCLDIGVLVSEVEGVPNVLLEYMLYSLPVIATNHSGCESLLQTSNFLIPNNKEILKNKLYLLINNKELRVKEGKENAEKIKKFGIDSYVTKLTSIINKVN